MDPLLVIAGLVISAEFSLLAAVGKLLADQRRQNSQEGSNHQSPR